MEKEIKKLTLKVSQSRPGEDPLVLEADCSVTKMNGTSEEIATMLMEAEAHFNEGRARLHLFIV